MKKHGLLIVLFVFSSGCALFGGSTTEEPAGCLAHPDQPQPNDARNYKASDAARDLAKRREEAEAAKRAAEQPPQASEKPAAPASPKSPKTKKEGKTFPVPQERQKEQLPVLKQPAPPADPELQKLKLKAEICEQVLEEKREKQKLREQLEEARRKLLQQKAQARPEPEDLPQTPMRPQYTANGSWWSWRTLGEGLGILFAWLLLILRGEAGLERWGQAQAARADRLEQEILTLKAEIAKLQAQLQPQQTPQN